jgi:ribosomal protein L17
MKHERITTTLAKAKEMQPIVEKIIHKAKKNDYQGNLFLKKTIFTSPEILKAKEISKRFE